MDLELWKQKKKELKLTIAEISEKANLPKGTVQNIFCGYIPNPRANTVQAIEKVLGIGGNKIELSQEEKGMLDLFRDLTESEKNVLISVAELLISKRD